MLGQLRHVRGAAKAQRIVSNGNGFDPLETTSDNAMVPTGPSRFCLTYDERPSAYPIAQ